MSALEQLQDWAASFEGVHVTSVDASAGMIRYVCENRGHRVKIVQPVPSVPGLVAAVKSTLQRRHPESFRYFTMYEIRTPGRTAFVCGTRERDAYTKAFPTCSVLRVRIELNPEAVATAVAEACRRAVHGR